MKSLTRMLMVLGLLGSVHTVPAAAQANGAASEASIPDQAWYPPGYHDLRLVAAVHIETAPRDPETMLLVESPESGIVSYSVIDCGYGQDLPAEMDIVTVQLAALAVDIARLRWELPHLGYRLEIYDQPLLDYERAALADIAARQDELLRDAEEYPPDPTFGHEAFANREILGELARDMETRRLRLQPEKEGIDDGDWCGSGYGPFTIELVPASGRLWLINAFAFRVCERKIADPWDHLACAGWTQYSAGDDTMASGRYMYEVRWPGGTVELGARILQPDLSQYNNGETVVFRRN